MSVTQDPSYYEAFEAEWAEESAWSAQLAGEAAEEMSEEAAAFVAAHEARIARVDGLLANLARIEAEGRRERAAILARASRESYGDYLCRMGQEQAAEAGYPEADHSLPGGEDDEARQNVRLLGVA